MKKYSIGIDLGGTKILLALVDKFSGEVVLSVKKKTRKEKGPEKIMSKMIDGIEELLEDSGAGIDEISSIGVGAAGQIDREHGILIGAPNLDCFDLNIKEHIQSHFDIPVYVGNDVEIAALGEMKFGAATGYDDFVCVFVGTGVGSAIVKNGKIIHGATGTAGEIGHIIVDLNGRQCNCGAHGCLEAYASRSAIEKRIEGALRKGRHSAILDYMESGKPITSSMIEKSIEREDELVTQCVTEASEYLSGGIASIINFINPKLIVLGGGLIEAVDYFYQNTIKKARAKSLPVPASKIEFKKAALGDFSGVIGAAFLEERDY
ncbi:ROK family protein [Spirochaetes bacterium]|uniref:ROK family protein n=1 Tax=Candidatus Scatousia excrementipullorum TaxID=2840936 RepID=A0A9D9DN34_9BACT|nr:ROK family protein [Candidatus Scatousia excrementipullorum]